MHMSSTQQKIQIAVLKTDELRLPSWTVAQELVAIELLVEGWEEPHGVYYGVARGHTLSDVERALTETRQRLLPVPS
ncbi:MAG TPA: hypothetical protein VFY16_12505 [Gemmatimonadaceae bacterium]|nr:hypothetical protein [Gemmatimonadaceae bacterium]